jgi:predicted MFS family arabinose efflux permease
MAPEARATGLALYSAAWALGQAAGVAAMGFAVSLTGYRVPIVLFGAAYLALGVWMRRNLGRL